MSEIVNLPGSGGWRASYEAGLVLEALFPDQDADQFAYCCLYNATPYGDGLLPTVDQLTMEQQGERDAGDWVWLVTFADGLVWRVTGGCDYTGWDCQSWAEWVAVES